MNPLIGANIMWSGEKMGTVSDLSGNFEISLSQNSKLLVVSYVGYSTDTIMIDKSGFVNIVISTPNLLDAVTITHKKRTTEISYLETVKVQNISSKELLKAACCNLAESFDTTPAVDASMTDAITGTKKIEMLGLAGPYVQITRENIPDVRGLAALQGLNYTPGPWVEGMQLNMGAGSVVNGFESITGQINVELKKPCDEEKMSFNAYGSEAGRYEMNTFAKQEVNENWSTATLLHASARIQRRDHNHDGYLDMPLSKQFGFINRWKYTNNNGQEGQIGIKVSYLDNISGQKSFNPGESDRTKVWGANIKTNRTEIWGKRGFVNLATPYKTLGFQFSGVYHTQDAQFGSRVYDATQKSLYFNMIYQSIIDNTDHQVRVGSSFQWDQFHELVDSSHYNRNEWVPGIFGEYTYKGSEKFSVLIGGRADYHNNFGLFFTPRLNIRYAPDQSTVFRIAAGRGQRTQSIFAEHVGVLASNRVITIVGQNAQNPYGLNAEVAWNLGVSMTKEIKLGSRNLLISFDANRIDFVNQIVADFDRNPQQIWFYNLTGKSYSNSAQLQLEIDVTKWLDVRLAYRYNDVKTTFGEKLLRKPLVSPQRAFANTAIKFGKGWTFDYTINWLNSVRIPSTASNPLQYRWEDKSPSYFLSNAQLSKSWKGNFEIYLGGENIFDYKLHNPIIAAGQPFSKYFDSSLAWGPIMGVNVYIGLRYSIK
ncbi:MAG: TonB-dependent receptor [Saprospiraceae bacterium]|nr:TonB-dependent receptor [Saprospiraceae bacterium]